MTDPPTRAQVLSAITRPPDARWDHRFGEVQFAGLNQHAIWFERRSHVDAVWSSLGAVLFAWDAWKSGVSWGGALSAGIGAFLTAFAVHDALFRETLVLDFSSRTWAHRSRWLGIRRLHRAGVFSDVEGLVL